jgi:hypothetical protein
MPTDWLVTGLRANESAAPLRELYRRELAENPERARDKEGADLLLHNADSSFGTKLANWRWLAAAQLERWDWISGDVSALRGRVRHTNPEQWVRLLISALEYVAWGTTKEAREYTARYAQEAQAHEDLHLRLGGEFDRMEQLLHITAKWRSLDQSGELPDVLAVLIPFCWERPESDLRPRLDTFLAEISRQPTAWLATLTKIHQQGAELIDLVLRTLHAQQASIAGHASLWRDADESRSAISDFLDSLAFKERLTNDDFRASLLGFCLAEAISPSTVASYFAAPKEYWQIAQAPLSQAIVTDVPLLCVCLAYQLFWA